MKWAVKKAKSMLCALYSMLLLFASREFGVVLVEGRKLKSAA